MCDTRSRVAIGQLAMLNYWILKVVSRSGFGMGILGDDQVLKGRVSGLEHNGADNGGVYEVFNEQTHCSNSTYTLRCP
jgi:hypothetical protein